MHRSEVGLEIDILEIKYLNAFHKMFLKNAWCCGAYLLSCKPCQSCGLREMSRIRAADINCVAGIAGIAGCIWSVHFVHFVQDRSDSQL